jgi:2'-5' RNA ligase
VLQPDAVSVGRSSVVAETAIVVPVPEAEAAVDLLRRRHTADGAEAMPAHITLLYPFCDSELLDSGLLDQIGSALASFAPFDDELSGVGRFERPVETVLWLAPTSAAPFVAMTDVLTAEFPEHPPYGGEFESIVPHLTVAVTGDQDLLRRIEADLARRLPIRIRVQEVALYEHAAAGWRARASWCLTPRSPLGPA